MTDRQTIKQTRAVIHGLRVASSLEQSSTTAHQASDRRVGTMCRTGGMSYAVPTHIVDPLATAATV